MIHVNASKSPNKLWIDPTVLFTSVAIKERSDRETNNFVVYIRGDSEVGLLIDEERFTIFRKFIKVYRVGGVVVEPASVRREAVKPQTSQLPSDTQNAIMRYTVSTTNLTKEIIQRSRNNLERLTETSMMDKKSKMSPHQRHKSNHTDIVSINYKTGVVEVVSFSYKGIVFDLEEPVSLELLVSVVPKEKIFHQKFINKYIILLLKLSKVTFSHFEGIQNDIIWKDVVSMNAVWIENYFEKTQRGSIHSFLDSLKKHIIQQNFKELKKTRHQATPFALQNPIIERSRDSLEFEMAEKSSLGKKTVKRSVLPQTQDLNLNQIYESLMIGIFASISCNPNQKDSFYNSRADDFNELLDHTLRFIVAEIKSKYKKEITIKDLVERLESSPNKPELYKFKMTGDLKILYEIISKNQIHIEEQGSALVKRFNNKPIRYRDIDPSVMSGFNRDPFDLENKGINEIIGERNKEIDRSPSTINKKNAIMMVEQGITRFENPNQKQAKTFLNSSIINIENEPKTSINQRTDNKLNRGKSLIPSTEIRIGSSLKLGHQGDEQMYASFFEEHWHILRNDMKDMLLKVSGASGTEKTDVLSKNLVHMTKVEVPQIISLLATQVLSKDRMNEEDLRREVVYHSMNFQTPEQVEKCNNEFHYTIFKCLLNLVQSEKIDPLKREMKMLFFYEDRFLLGAYEIFLSSFLRNPEKLQALILDFEENLGLLVRVIQDNEARFVLPLDKRRPSGQVTIDDEAVIKEFCQDLSKSEMARLHRTVYFNRSGLLHNLYMEYLDGSMKKKDFINQLRNFCSLYEDINQKNKRKLTADRLLVKK